MQYNASAIFTAAHKEARAIRANFETYRDAFAFALAEAYAEARKAAEKTTAEKLEDLGVSAWECGSMVRYYLNDEDLAAVFGLEISRYKSGNICYAAFNGETISHAKAYRLMGQKIFFDAVKGEWMQKRDGATVAMCAELAAACRV